MFLYTVVADALEKAGCDEQAIDRAKNSSRAVAAIWHVYLPRHAEKVYKFISQVRKFICVTLGI